MNTIKTHTEWPTINKIRKRDLLIKIEVLTDVVQSLIDRIAEKEKIQLGVMAENRCNGVAYFLYQQPLDQCANCMKDLPPQKHGDETYFSETKDPLCYECFNKSQNTPKC